MEKSRAPLYLRDLLESEERAFLAEWNAKGLTKLLKLHKQGLDITIGEYYNDAEIFAKL